VYAGFSKRIVDSFIAETTLKTWMAKKLAVSVELNLQDRNATQLLIDPMRFESLTEVARLQGSVSLVAWTPWITTEHTVDIPGYLPVKCGDLGPWSR